MKSVYFFILLISSKFNTMAIGCWEQFIGNNWERYANICGGVTACLVIFFACMTWFFKFNTGIGVYTFFVGLFMLWLETPLSDWIGPCMKCKNIFNETLQLQQPALRAVIYILASILTFLYSTPCIGGGIFMLITSILKFFAQINKAADAKDNQNNLNTKLNSSNVV